MEVVCVGCMWEVVCGRLYVGGCMWEVVCVGCMCRLYV